MGVPNAIGDVRVTGVVDKVLFFFRTHPTIEVTGKYVIVLTMEVLWGVCVCCFVLLLTDIGESLRSRCQFLTAVDLGWPDPHPSP